MNHYKTRKDDQLLQEAYNDIVEERLGKIAASLAAAAALATGGSTRTDQNPQDQPNRPVVSAHAHGQQDQHAHLVSAFNALLKQAKPNEVRQLQALWPRILDAIKKGVSKPFNIASLLNGSEGEVKDKIELLNFMYDDFDFNR